MQLYQCDKNIRSLYGSDFLYDFSGFFIIFAHGLWNSSQINM